MICDTQEETIRTKCYLLFSSHAQGMGSKYGYPVCRQCICLCYVYCIIRFESRKKELVNCLNQAAREMDQGNTRQQLNKLGSVFLTNRQVSAQEAVYRVLSIPL